MRIFTAQDTGHQLHAPAVKTLASATKEAEMVHDSTSAPSSCLVPEGSVSAEGTPAKVPAAPASSWATAIRSIPRRVPQATSQDSKSSSRAVDACQVARENCRLEELAAQPCQQSSNSPRKEAALRHIHMAMNDSLQALSGVLRPLSASQVEMHKGSNRHPARDQGKGRLSGSPLPQGGTGISRSPSPGTSRLLTKASLIPTRQPRPRGFNVSTDERSRPSGKVSTV